MGSEIVIMPMLFAVIFGVVYLFYSTRNKERLALIEKGLEAGIFNQNKSKPAPIWKLLFLNTALVLIGVGLGIFIGAVLSTSLGVSEDVAYPGTIFTLAGIGLLIGYNLSTKEEKN
jgi:hypothetical protein